jgi:proteasome-associated ATPase
MPATSDLLNHVYSAPPRTRRGVLDHILEVHPELAAPAARDLLERASSAEQALEKTGQSVLELKAMLDEITEPPSHTGGIIAIVGDRYIVAIGQSRQEVKIHPAAQSEQFQVGDAVALSRDASVIVRRLPDYQPPGRVVTVRGWHGNRLRVEYLNDQTMIVDASPAVREAQPREGDQVLVHDDWKVALELVERASAVKTDQLDPISFDEIGGLDELIAELKMTVESRFIYPEKAAEVGLNPMGGMTFVGVPGSGKTLLVRGLVHHVRQKAGMRVDFENVPPGSWRSQWFGASEHQIVEPITRAERRLAEGECELVILFYDELDTLGTRATDVTSRIDSRVQSALLHKIDGVAARWAKRQILLVGATNRIDLIDEALIRPGRFGDQITYIPRPNREAARAIFRCHLSPSVRFWTNGEAAAPEEMVEKCASAAVARIFADAEPADALAELVLAGGERQPIWPRQVVSGALIAGIVQRAKRQALRRGFAGPAGLIPDDFARAADFELDTIATRLVDPHKVREVLGDLTLPVVRGIPRRRHRAQSGSRGSSSRRAD